MLSLRYATPAFGQALERTAAAHPRRFSSVLVCGARGPRPRYPRVWKTDKRIGTVSKSQKLVKCVIKWMFNKGQGKTMGSYQTLLTALIADGRVEEAEELFGKIFSRYMEGLPRIFFMQMISLYYSLGSYQKMFEVFADMEELGVRPDRSIVRLLSVVFKKLDMLDKYEKLNRKYPPPKFEYRYIKGKRIRMRVYPDDSTEERTQRDSDTDGLKEVDSINLDNELEEVASTGLDRNVLGDAACGDLEFV